VVVVVVVTELVLPATGTEVDGAGANEEVVVLGRRLTVVDVVGFVGGVWVVGGAVGRVTVVCTGRTGT
jgi:hypothetical protein